MGSGVSVLVAITISTRSPDTTVSSVVAWAAVAVRLRKTEPALRKLVAKGVAAAQMADDFLALRHIPNDLITGAKIAPRYH